LMHSIVHKNSKFDTNPEQGCAGGGGRQMASPLFNWISSYIQVQGGFGFRGRGVLLI